jgi:hypothetical protein
MNEVHVSIQQNWDSGIIGMTKGPIGDIGQILYDLTPWGQNDEIKRNYLVDPSDIRSKNFRTTGIDSLDSESSRHKESLTGLRQDEDNDLLNLIVNKDYENSIGGCRSGIQFSQNCNFSSISEEILGLSQFSIMHDKQCGSGGVEANWSCGSFLGAAGSIMPSLAYYSYGFMGGNNVVNPFNGSTFVGQMLGLQQKQNNYNKTNENAKDSNIEIGGKFYLDDVEKREKFTTTGGYDQDGKWKDERVYGGTVITSKTAEKEKAKYFRNCLTGIQQCE